MTDQPLIDGPELVAVAQKYVDGASVFASGRQPLSRLSSVTLDLDLDYCVAVADHYDRAPRMAYSPAVRRSYDRMKEENADQFHAITAAGIEVEPWLGSGQPYRNSLDLRAGVLETGRIHVFLTRAGHGPGGIHGYHPLREGSGIVIRGVEFTHNDIFRVVHDVFGHVMPGNSFGPRGELLAAYCHMHMYSDDVHPVIFIEHVGQICWFFYGPHLRDAAGLLPGPGEPGYVPPPARPYATQKVFPFERKYIDRFHSMFSTRELG
ncbi:crotonobetainyl-CoA--carnitine CoA-transferase [Nonomuraea sp. NPDC049152]|uniref:crotonobetainyl-CoA--carnitine CoA-transferase n=1 Tax=Nonomuraea sp. NPDC049152 TaxID=3154350 RepID=UPI0033D08D07